MISAKELNPHNYPTTQAQADNLDTLLRRINIIRAAWGKPMTVTSGLRTPEDQARINPSKPHSNHLIGAAVDIEDKDGSLYDWLTQRTGVLRGAGLFCELGTKGWCHFQIVSPPSGNVWFLP